MPSNSLRVSAALFERARVQGELMSRSTALQIEHWARIGEAVEALGLSVAQLTELLQERLPTPSTAQAEVMTEEELWKFKRERQAQDIANVQQGRATHEQMSWFSGGKAKSATIENSAL